MGHCSSIQNEEKSESDNIELKDTSSLSNFDKEENVAEYELIMNGNATLNVFKLNKNMTINNKYTIKKILGKGGSCRVLLVSEKHKSKNKYAMKELYKNDEWNPILFKKEIDILNILKNHNNILKYHESYISDKYLYILTHLCEGGELLKRIKQLKHYSEKSASELLKVILQTINFIHNNNIAHRDLKPENIVYRNYNNNLSDIIIIDFGDATLLSDTDQIFSDFVGTPFYLAPECVRNRYGWELFKSDMWAIGVITFVLLYGKPPFYATSNQAIINQITSSNVYFPKSPKISESAKNFMLNLLCKNTRKRLTSSQALVHPWITNKNDENSDKHLGDRLIENIGKFDTATKLKKLIITQMIKNMTHDEKVTIANAFKSLDTNNDGFIDEKELIQYLIQTGYLSKLQAKQRAKQLIMVMDKDGDGLIDLNEWVYGKTASKLRTDQSQLKIEFDKLKGDATKDGKTLTRNEFRKSLGSILDDDRSGDIDDIMDEIETDEQGNVTFEGFSKAVKSQTIRSE